MDQAQSETLTQIAHAFAAQSGDISIIIESRTDPERLVEVNADRRLPSASVIKAAIACAAADLPNLDLTDTIAVRELDPTFYCSIVRAFAPEDRLTLKSLIGLMLIVSDNPATTAVLNALGLESINDWFARNGLANTHIEVGFDDASLGAPLRANLTTARDCLRLLRLVDAQPKYAFIKHMLANNLRNERIPKMLPDDVVTAHKTGTLNGLVHDIAIIESPTAAFYLIVLADGLPDGHDFAREIARFSKQVYELMAG